jgi:hypothetical protein
MSLYQERLEEGVRGKRGEENSEEPMLTTRTGTSSSTPRRAALFTATPSRLFLFC